jgi:2-amino-4-hydroxy-6-hydroxymethyldihydropteridine diphosphokinase
MGSNIEPHVNIERAATLLRESYPEARFSRVFETEPVGAPQDPWFLNAAAAIATELHPRELKFEVLRPLEVKLGRQRTTDRNAPRTIDLDIAMCGDMVVKDIAVGLEIPDPLILTTAHIALPLADLAPEFLHPITGQSLRQIASSLAPGQTVRPVAGMDLGRG